jgi:hypothetical protein
MGKAVTGCTPNEISGVALTEKKWSPIKEDFRLKHCSAEVNVQDKLINQYVKLNPDFYSVIEGSQSTVGSFLVMKIEEGFRENLLRKVWFNSKTAAVLPGGNITIGTDLGYFNTLDGLFVQIFTAIPTTSKYYTPIAKNLGATYALQALASGDAMATLKSVYNKADKRMRNTAGVTFKVTSSIFDGYLNDLEALQNAGAGNTMINENGQLTLTYRGIPLEVMDIWDRTIDQYYNNGTKWDKPHRIVMTVSSNIPIGTPSTDDFGTVDAFYDKVTKQNYIDGIYGLDVLLLETYMTSVAY